MLLTILIGLLTVAVAVLGAVTWRLAAVERRRSDARIAALAKAIDTDDLSLEAFDGEVADTGPTTIQTGMSLSMPESRGPSRAPAFAAAIVLVLGAGAVLTAAFSGGNRAERRPSPSRPSIELVSMRHVVDGDTLIVSGLVRNASTVSLPSLAAELSVLGRDGQIMARGRSMLEPPALGAGKETSFRVAVSDARDAGRYRVAFSTANRIVPHIDRRDDIARAARSADE